MLKVDLDNFNDSFGLSRSLRYCFRWAWTCDVQCSQLRWVIQIQISVLYMSCLDTLRCTCNCNDSFNVRLCWWSLQQCYAAVCTVIYASSLKSHLFVDPIFQLSSKNDMAHVRTIDVTRHLGNAKVSMLCNQRVLHAFRMTFVLNC